MIVIESTEWKGIDGMGAAEMKKMRAPGERAVRKAVRHFVNEVKKTLQGKRTGRIYPLGFRGRTYQASSPGEPPASRHGHLRQSFTATEPVWRGDDVSAEAGSPLPQARRLEYGGTSVVPRDVNVQVEPGVWRKVKAGTIVRILPRPYVEPTLQREWDRITEILAEATHE